LRLFGSKEGQNTFNPLKGSISARSDAILDSEDAKLYDEKAQQTILDLRTAATQVPATAILAPQEFIDAVDDALFRFAGGGDGNPPVVGNKSYVLHTIDNWSDMLLANPW
jgi:glucose/mannose transport system substrate-binding protein